MIHDEKAKIHFRKALSSDAASISSVVYESFAEYRSQYTAEAFHKTCPTSEQVLERMKEGPIWVVLLNGKIVGTVSVVESDEGLYIRGMAVLPEARGRGIGRLILEEMQGFAVTKGHGRLILGTTPFLLRAINLYKHFGFRRCRRRPIDYFGTRIFMMEKRRIKGQHR